MRLKSFYGEDLKKVMALIREELGDEAIIIATREEENGNVKVTAAIEDDDQQESRGRAELENKQVNVIDQISNQLYYHGVPNFILEDILDAYSAFPSGDTGLSLSSIFENNILFEKISSYSDISSTSKKLPIMFIGQPGVGKTSTLTKLATRAALNNESVSIITTDTTRAGAIDELLSITKLLNVELLSLEDIDCLEAAIDVYKHVDRIFIDTAGMNPFATEDLKLLQDLISSIEIDPLMILSAGTDAYETIEIMSAVQEIGVKKVLTTKLDITKRYGNILACVYKRDISLTHYSQSSRVKDELKAYNPVDLFRLIFPQLNIGR